jgi:WS/DGAT/MGAT family acyltransferase
VKVKATQLTAFDASFLALDTNVSVGHVTLLSLLDREVSLEELFHQIEARLHLVPMLRRKLRAPSLIVGRPWWIDDPEFDLDQHLRFSDLGGQADEAAMCAEAIRFSCQHLDRSRPLWEVLLIGGLADGSGAMVSKIHHCAVDGVGKRDLLSLLFGTERSLDPHRRWRPDGGPGQLSRVTHRVTEATERTGAALRLELQAMTAAPAAVLKATRDTATRLADGLERLVEGADALAPEPDWARVGTPPATPFNAAISAKRAWAWMPMPVTASSAVRRATGTTLNDILMAATAGALRAWLAENDALTGDPLVAMVPMSIRGQGHTVASNQIMLTLCPLPTHLDTPRERLEFVHSAMAHAKSTPTYPSTLMSDLAAVAGPTVTQLLTQAAAIVRLADRVQLPFNLMVSNVPAPAREFIVGRGARVVGSFPFPPLSDGMGLTVCAQGYPGALDIGVGSCPDLLPDPWRVRDLLAQAHEDLIDSA